MKSKLDRSKKPWSPRAQQEVSNLRSAITNHLDEPMVSSSAAPMLGELLTRLKGFSDPGDAADLRQPPMPDDQNPLSQADAANELHDACGTLRQRLLAGSDDAQTSGNLQAMVEVIEDHLSMKNEILARSTSDARPG